MPYFDKSMYINKVTTFQNIYIYFRNVFLRLHISCVKENLNILFCGFLLFSHLRVAIFQLSTQSFREQSNLIPVM